MVNLKFLKNKRQLSKFELKRIKTCPKGLQEHFKNSAIEVVKREARSKRKSKIETLKAKPPRKELQKKKLNRLLRVMKIMTSMTRNHISLEMSFIRVTREKTVGGSEIQNQRVAKDPKIALWMRI